jgi:molybdate transport system substrate-binding protein
MTPVRVSSRSSPASLAGWFLLLFASLATTVAAAGEVRVAAASNLSGVIERVAAAFHRDTGHELVIAFGATGRLYEQVVKGVPYDVLLSADQEAPKRLEQQGLARPGTRFTYATGKLVLWSAREVPMNGHGEVLRLPSGGRLAIADPRDSPYGAAAIEALRHLGVLETWQPQLLVAPSVTQAYQLAASGRAWLGLIALSQVAENGRIVRGSGWILPSSLYPPLEQDAVLLNGGAQNPAAIAFLAYLRSNAARAILRAAGYGI